MHFFLHDVLAGLLAVLLFSIFLLAPGYGIARGLDLCEFSRRDAATRLALALVISLAVTPGLGYLIARIWSVRVAVGFVAALAAAGAVNLAFGDQPIATLFRAAWRESRSFRWTLWISVGWILAAILILSDVQIGARVYPNVVAFDYTLRIAITSTITRTDVPPANPYFYPGHLVPLYYYYFWFLTCSLVDTLGGAVIEARHAVMGGTAWAGLGLLAIVGLYLRLFKPYPRAWRSVPPLFACALLLISGLDIVPFALKYVYHWLHGRFPLYNTVEWWNEQVTAWPIAVMWVPHHVAALVASLTVFLVFTEASSRDDQSRRTAGPLLVCAIGFLSVLGMSIWLAFAFAVFWGAWLLTAAVKRWYRELRLGLVISVVAGALSIPYLLDLHTANLARGNPIAIVVRPFFPIHSVLGQEAVSPWWVQVIDLAALPINYFLEFGVLAIAAYVYWRARRHADAPLSRNELALVVLAVSVTVIISLLRSSLSNNDLGWRTAMFVQFALLLWSAPVLSAWWYSRLHRFAAFDPRAKRRVSSVLGVCLILGMMPPAYDIVLMKMFSMWGDVGLPGERRYGLLEEPDLGRRYYDLREAYAWIDRNLPNSAVLQHNPNVSIDAPSGIYGQRQVVAADRYYGTLLGVPYELYHPVAAAVAPIFESQTIEIRDIVRLCDRFGVTALVTKDTDLAWQDPRSWVWQATPSFANRSVRVYLCEALPTNARHGH